MMIPIYRSLLSLYLVSFIIVVITSQSIPEWILLGSPLKHDAIQAVSLDFDDLNMGYSSAKNTIETVLMAPTQGKGLPILAYGYYNSSTQGSTINIISYHPSTMNEPIVNNQSSQGTWTIIAQHTPQFAQPYDNFNFKIRNNGLLYLGLRIDENDFMLSSVLKGERGMSASFEGCYAFNGYIFDYDINDIEPNTGDIKLITSPDNTTLSFATYGHTGYNTYPATDTWGPNIPITPALPTNTFTIDNVMLTTQFTLDRTAVFMAYDQSGNTSVGLLSLQINSIFLPYTSKPFNGNLVGLAYTPWVTNTSTGLLCVALANDDTGTATSSTINVECVADNGSGSPSPNDWNTIGTPLNKITPHDHGMGVPLGFTTLQYNVTHIAIVVVGLDASNNTLLHSSWILCSLTVTNVSFQCSSVWTTGPQVQTQQIVNNLELNSPSVWQSGGLSNVIVSNTAILTVSEGIGQNGPGDVLSIYGILLKDL